VRNKSIDMSRRSQLLPLHTFINDKRSRVTRLGEFSPIGRFYSLGSFLKITEVAQILGLFFQGKSYVLILTKDGLDYNFGNF
jgi:hypothetical protein